MDKSKEEARNLLVWYVRDMLVEQKNSRASIFEAGFLLGALFGRTDEHFDDTTPHDECDAEDITFVFNKMIDAIKKAEKE